MVCNPLGKSGGALIQQFLIITCGSLANSTPYLGGILLVIVLAWLAAARSLDRQFTPLAKKDLKDKLIEGKVSAIKKSVPAKPRQGVAYRFVSTLNSMGFIEGKYVAVIEDVSSSTNEVLTVKRIAVTKKIDTYDDPDQAVDVSVEDMNQNENSLVSSDGNGMLKKE